MLDQELAAFSLQIILLEYLQCIVNFAHHMAAFLLQMTLLGMLAMHSNSYPCETRKVELRTAYCVCVGAYLLGFKYQLSHLLFLFVNSCALVPHP